MFRENFGLDEMMTITKQIFCNYRKNKKSRNPRTIEGLRETCSATGGLFMESSKIDVGDIVALLSQSIESSKVSQ